MRMGLILSGFLHSVLIGFGIFTIAGSNLDHHALDVESITIELAPISDEMAVREGDKQAPVTQSPAPKPTQKPEINNQARHVGDGEIDSAAPLKPQTKVREVEATPPPVGQQPALPENTTPAHVPQQQAATPPERPAPDQPSPAQPIPDQPMPAQPMPAQPMPDQPLETAAIIPSLPQNVPQPRQKPKPAQKPLPGEKTQETLVEKPSDLIDRTPTQGGGMRRSSQPAGAGATRSIGDNQQLSQTIQNVIGACIEDKARIAILSGSESHDLVVRVHMRLNRDGSIDGVPDLTPSGGQPYEREIAVTQAYDALARCAPFIGLPPERYDDGWFDVTLNWRPLKK